MNQHPFQRLSEALFRPLDIASLVFIRIAFGLLMFWEVWRYFAGNRIFRYWLQPEFNFTYPGFDWVTHLPGDGMYYLFIGFGILSLLIATGFLYRIATTLFFIGFTYMFLLEQGRYLNHFYLVCLVSFVIIFLPANRSFSLDEKFGLTKPSDTAPAWAVWILPFLMGVVYFYGGIAKINPDWLAGEPLRDWLDGRSDYPIIGGFLASEPVVMLFSWGGMLFDLLITFALLWKPTRMLGFIIATSFHVTNMVVWNIGIFPWLAIALTAMFFPPSWPRRFFCLPIYERSYTIANRWRTVATALLCIFLAGQLLIPLRHWLYKGNVVWTEEGHRFSWRMKLRSRDGLTDFYVVDKDSGRLYEIDPFLYMLDWQVEEMDTNPDMMIFFAHKLKKEFLEQKEQDVSVHAKSVISVNGRPDQTYIKETVDLSTISRFERRDRWLYEFDPSGVGEGREESLALE